MRPAAESTSKRSARWWTRASRQEKWRTASISASSTVRHWLRKHNLRTHRSRRADSGGVRAVDPDRRFQECERHGTTEFWLEARGIYRCLRCRSEAVARRRRRLKEILVEEAGGSCSICGYDRYVGALQFHHRDGAVKAFGLGDRGLTRSLAAVRAEAAKCVLLCGNCHSEVEAGIVKVTDRATLRKQVAAGTDHDPG